MTKSDDERVPLVWWRASAPELNIKTAASGFSTALWAWPDGTHESAGEPSQRLNTVAFAVDTFDTEFAVDGRQLFRGPFRVGMTAVVPSKQHPEVVQRGRGRKLHLYLPDSILADAAGHDPEADASARIQLRPRAGRDAGAAAICRRVLAQFDDAGVGSQLLREALGIELAVHAIRHWATMPPADPPRTRPLPPKALRRVVDYLRADLSANPSLSTLAALTGLSRAHLCRTFTAATGMAPHQYLIGLRIDAACEQLAHTEASIAEIALSVGYDDPNYFARMFKRRIGDTPSAFRRQHRD